MPSEVYKRYVFVENINRFSTSYYSPYSQEKNADVTVLTPPAVLAGEPPIYISTMEITFEAYVILPCPIESKPAVLNVTDWNKLAKILWKNEKFPIV